MNFRLTYCLFLLVALHTVAYSQKAFHFDFYTSYELRKSERDTVSSTAVIFSNFENPHYFLKLVFVKNTLQGNAQLTDLDQLKVYDFPDIKNIEGLTDDSFKRSSWAPLSVRNWQRSKTSYAINYQTENLTDKTIEIKIYENKKHKNLLEDYVIKTVPTQLTKNQKYNFGPLIFPLLVKHIDIQSEGLITEGYTVKDKQKVNILTLKDIQQVNFTITIATNN